jgi:hypothetical protein
MSLAGEILMDISCRILLCNIRFSCCPRARQPKVCLCNTERDSSFHLRVENFSGRGWNWVVNHQALLLFLNSSFLYILCLYRPIFRVPLFYVTFIYRFVFPPPFYIFVPVFCTTLSLFMLSCFSTCLLSLHRFSSSEHDICSAA